MAESQIAEHIQGTEDEGEQPNGYPVRISGKDSVTGANRAVEIDNATGAVKVLSAGGGGGAVTIADGADVCQGATTDAAVSGDANGTVSGKLRQLNKILTAVWDSALNVVKVRGATAYAGAIAGLAGTAILRVQAFLMGMYYTDGTHREVQIGPNFGVLNEVLDGSDRALGATTDAAVSGDVNGTVSAKLRQLNKILTAVWDSVNNRLNVNAVQSGSWSVTLSGGAGPTTNGQVSVSGTALTIKKQKIDIATAGDNTVIASVASKKIRILSVSFRCAAKQTIIFKSNAGNTIIPGMQFDVRQGLDFPIGAEDFFMETNSGEAFILNLSIAQQVSGIVSYVEV